jgi:serine/threonine protein kinase
MSNSPPSTLGKYQIIREIARSNDIVYEAYDPLMNRRVALKELAMPGGSTPQQREDRINRFKREAQAAGTLNHANIMTVYEMGQEGDRLYMAMEYLDGHTLRNEIDTRGFLPLERALEIAQEILQGLEHAHKQGVVHRDIKPDNIQILSNGSIKITDFGIARLTFQPNLTMDGQVFGTPSYMSPEQVVGKEIDARSDLFSVGIVLYEMIGGQKPFGGDSVVSITYAIMNKEPDRLNQISYPLWQVLARAMDKTPAMRYSSAPDMMQALDDAQRGTGPGGVVLSPPVQTSQTTVYGTGATGMPQAGNPYLNPFPQQTQSPAPPPVAYPYNPYSQPGQTNMPPHTPGLPPGFGQVPIYYPPPPRQPLIKPETKQFLGKLLISFIVIGSLFALILVGINSLGQVLEKSNAQRADSDVVRQIKEIDPKLPVDQQIRELEGLIGRLRGEVQQKEAKANLAVLYERQGKNALGKGDLITAEDLFTKAVDSDPDNAALYTNLGDLYARKARDEQDPSTRATLWRQSAESWKGATDKEPNRTKQGAYGEAAAIAYYNLAVEMSRNSDYPRSEVRAALYEAQKYAPNGSQISQAVATFLNQVDAG